MTFVRTTVPCIRLSVMGVAPELFPVRKVVKKKT